MLATHIQSRKPASTTKAIDGIWPSRCRQTTPEDLAPVERLPGLAAAADLVEADRREGADQRKGEGEGHDPEGAVEKRRAGGR